MRVAIDTWAFRELAAGTTRGEDVTEVIEAAESVFTVRECVVETYGALLKQTRRPDVAWAWWEGLRAAGIRVYEPPLDEVHDFASRHVVMPPLSLADWSLAYAAKRERTRAILTEDAEFRRLDLDPLFAAR